MTKKDFVSDIALKLGVSKSQADDTIKIVLDSICEAVENDGKVMLWGNYFKKRIRPERKCRNPRTGETITVPERAEISFRKAIAN